MAARAVNFTSTGQVVSNDTRYYGVTARETGGTATVTVNLYAGTTTAGDLLATFTLDAGQSWDADVAAPIGVYATKGINAEVSGSGTLKASVRVG